MANDSATKVSTLLERLVAELQELTSKTEELQADISPLVADLTPSDSRAAKALQSLDVISQHLAALTQYSSTMSQTVPRDVTIDDVRIADQIGLEVLAARLAGKEASTAKPSNVAGDCDFF